MSLARLRYNSSRNSYPSFIYFVNYALSTVLLCHYDYVIPPLFISLHHSILSIYKKPNGLRRP